MEDKTMALVKSLNRVMPSMPSLFDRFFEGDLMDWTNGNFADFNSTLPAVNVSEDDNGFRIEVAAPGMRKEDFKINIENGHLVITSERKDQKEDEKKGKYSRQEFRYESFQRSFAIPEELVNAEKIEAKYHDGILHITLPKREVKPKTAKEIKIQ